MTNFQDYYMTEGFFDELRRAFSLQNIFSVRTLGLNLNQLDLQKLDKTAYRQLFQFLRSDAAKIQRGSKALKGLKGDKRTDKFNSMKRQYPDRDYIKKVMKGEIDKGDLPENYDSIEDVSVYQTFKGIPRGKIVMINAIDPQGRDLYYIGVNRGGENFIRDKFKSTTAGLAASSTQKKRQAPQRLGDLMGTDIVPLGIGQAIGPNPFSSRRKITAKGVKTSNKKVSDQGYDDKEVEEFLSNKAEVSETELGLIDMTEKGAKELIDVLSDGKKGVKTAMRKGEDYKYKDAFKRERFDNDWGNGFEYKLSSSDSFYILIDIDSDDALIIFSSPRAYKVAGKLEILNATLNDVNDNPSTIGSERINWGKGYNLYNMHGPR